MSLDFSQQYDAPIVTTSLTPQDEGEISLRPKLLENFITLYYSIIKSKKQ